MANSFTFGAAKFGEKSTFGKNEKQRETGHSISRAPSVNPNELDKDESAVYEDTFRKSYHPELFDDEDSALADAAIQAEDKLFSFRDERRGAVANAAIKPDKLIGGWNLNGPATLTPTLDPTKIEDPGDLAVYEDAFRKSISGAAGSAYDNDIIGAGLEGEHALKVKYGYANPKTVTTGNYANQILRNMDALEAHQEEQRKQQEINQGALDMLKGEQGNGFTFGAVDTNLYKSNLVAARKTIEDEIKNNSMNIDLPSAQADLDALNRYIDGIDTSDYAKRQASEIAEAWNGEVVDQTIGSQHFYDTMHELSEKEKSMQWGSMKGLATIEDIIKLNQEEEDKRVKAEADRSSLYQQPEMVQNAISNLQNYMQEVGQTYGQGEAAALNGDMDLLQRLQKGKLTGMDLVRAINAAEAWAKPQAQEKEAKAQAGVPTSKGDTSAENVWRTIQAINSYEQNYGSINSDDKQKYERQKAMLQAYLSGEASSQSARDDVVDIINEWDSGLYGNEYSPAERSKREYQAQMMYAPEDSAAYHMAEKKLYEMASDGRMSWGDLGQLYGQMATNEFNEANKYDVGSDEWWAHHKRGMAYNDQAEAANDHRLTLNDINDVAYNALTGVGFPAFESGLHGFVQNTANLAYNLGELFHLNDLVDTAAKWLNEKVWGVKLPDNIDIMRRGELAIAESAGSAAQQKMAESDAWIAATTPQMVSALEKVGVDKLTAESVTDTALRQVVQGSAQSIAAMYPSLLTMYVSGAGLLGGGKEVTGGKLAKFIDALRQPGSLEVFINEAGEATQRAREKYGDNVTKWDLGFALLTGLVNTGIENYDGMLGRGIQSIMMSGSSGLLDLAASQITEPWEEVRQEWTPRVNENLADWFSGRQLSHALNTEEKDALFNVAEYLDVATSAFWSSLGMNTVMAGVNLAGKPYRTAVEHALNGTATPQEKVLVQQAAVTAALEMEAQKEDTTVTTPNTEDQHKIFENAVSGTDNKKDVAPGSVDRRAQAATNTGRSEEVGGRSYIPPEQRPVKEADGRAATETSREEQFKKSYELNHIEGDYRAKLDAQINKVKELQKQVDELKAKNEKKRALNKALDDLKKAEETRDQLYTQWWRASLEAQKYVDENHLYPDEDEIFEENNPEQMEVRADALEQSGAPQETVDAIRKQAADLREKQAADAVADQEEQAKAQKKQRAQIELGRTTQQIVDAAKRNNIQLNPEQVQELINGKKVTPKPGPVTRDAKVTENERNQNPVPPRRDDRQLQEQEAGTEPVRNQAELQAGVSQEEIDEQNRRNAEARDQATENVANQAAEAQGNQADARETAEGKAVAYREMNEVMQAITDAAKQNGIELTEDEVRSLIMQGETGENAGYEGEALQEERGEGTAEGKPEAQGQTSAEKEVQEEAGGAEGSQGTDVQEETRRGEGTARSEQETEGQASAGKEIREEGENAGSQGTSAPQENRNNGEGSAQGEQETGGEISKQQVTREETGENAGNEGAAEAADEETQQAGEGEAQGRQEAAGETSAEQAVQQQLESEETAGNEGENTEETAENTEGYGEAVGRTQEEAKNAETVSKSNGWSFLSDDRQQATPGVNVRSWSGSGVSETQKAQLQRVDWMAKRHNVIAIVDSTVDGGIANGKYSPRDQQGRLVVHIAQDAENPLDTVFSHELYHLIAANNPKAAQQIERAVADFMRRRGMDIENEVENLRTHYREASEKIGGKIRVPGDAVLREEVVANSIYDAIGDENTIRALAAQNRGLVQKIHDWISKVMKDIHEMLNQYTDRTPAAKALQETEGAMDKLRKMIEDALEEIGRLEQVKKAGKSLGSNSRMTAEFAQGLDEATSFSEANKAAHTLAESILREAGLEATPKNVNDLIGTAQMAASGMMISEAAQGTELAGAIKNSPEMNRAVMALGRYANSLAEQGSEADYMGLYGIGEENTEENTEGEGVRYSAKNTGDVVHIKDQIKDNSDMLNKMDVIVKVSSNVDLSKYYNAGAKHRKDAWKAYAKDLFAGKKIYREGVGEIEITESQIQTAMSYCNNEGECAAVLTVPDVIKNGKEIFHDNNWKENRGIFDTWTFAAPVEIDGKRGNVGVVVRRSKEGNKYKTHRILMPDGSVFELDKNTNKQRTAPATRSADNNQQQAQHTSSVYSIKTPTDNNVKYSFKSNATNTEEVIRKWNDNIYQQAVDSGNVEEQQRLVDQAAEAAMPDSKMRDDNGKLKEFYHGTNGDGFTVFDKNLIGTAREGDVGFFGRGFYFAFSKGEAEMYGKNVMPVYLNIKKPFNFEKELLTLNGKHDHLERASTAVFLTNFANKFPELAKKHRVTVFERGNNEGKDLTLKEFADQFMDVVKNKEFDVQPIETDYGTEWLVTADPVTYTYTDSEGKEQSYKDYDYQERFFSKKDTENVANLAYNYMKNVMYSNIFMPRSVDVIQETDFSDAVQKRGYDGIIQSENGDEAVVFESSQAKLTDPITYDDAGNVIPLSERFNDQNDDIRWSMKDQPGSDERVADEKRLNEAAMDTLGGDMQAWDLLSAMRDIKRRLTQDADGKDVAEKGYWKGDVKKIVQALEEDTGSSGRTKEITKLVTEFFQDLDNFDGSNAAFFDYALREAQALVTDLYRGEHRAYNAAMAEEYENGKQALKEYFRGGYWYIDPAMKEYVDKYLGGWREFRKVMNANGIKVTTVEGQKKNGRSYDLESVWRPADPQTGRSDSNGLYEKLGGEDTDTVGDILQKAYDAVTQETETGDEQLTMEEYDLTGKIGLSLVADYLQAGAKVITTHSVEKIDDQRHRETVEALDQAKAETEAQRDEIQRKNDQIEELNGEIDKLRTAMSKEIGRTYELGRELKALKENGADAAQLAQVKEELRLATAERQKAQNALEKAQAKLAAQKEEMKDLKAQLRKAERAQERAMSKLEDAGARRAETMAAYREKIRTKYRTEYKDKIAAAKARQQKTKVHRKLVNSIRKTGATLRSYLAHPNASNGFIPQENARAAAELIEALMVNDGRKSAAQASRRLMDSIRDAKESPNYFVSTMYDDELNKAMQDVARMLEDKRSLQNLSDGDLALVEKTLKAIVHQIKNAGQTIGRKRNAELASESADGVLVMNRNKLKMEGLGRLIRKFGMTQLNAQRFFDIWGHHADNAITRMGEDLSEGQRKKNKLTMDMTKVFEGLTQGENEKKFDKFTGKNATWYDTGIEILKSTGDSSGKTWKMNGAMRAFFALSFQTLDNRNGMVYETQNGHPIYQLTIPNEELMKQGKEKEAYARGDRVFFTTEQAEHIIDELTDYEEEWVKAWQRMEKLSKEAINETSLLLNGFRKANVAEYVPIFRDPRFIGKEFESVLTDSRLTSMGFLKERVDAHNPMMLMDLTNVINRQVRDVSDYYGFAIPTRNATKIYNGNLGGTSFKEVLNKTQGPEVAKYFEKLMADLQGGSRVESSFLDRLRGNVAGATLAGNPSVIIKQAASYPAAASVLGWGPLLKGLKYFNPASLRKIDVNEIDKYTSALWERRSRSLSDLEANANRNTAMSKLLHKLTNGIQGMDIATTKVIWKAAEYYVDEHSPNLQRGTEEYNNAVARIYEQALEGTQPEYGTMQRPQILRSTNQLVKSLTMYKTQSLQNFGILVDAATNLSDKAKADKAKSTPETQEALRQAKRQMATALSSQITSAVILGVMTAVGKALLHKLGGYRDDKGDLTVESVGGQILKDSASSVAGMVAGGSELFDMINGLIEGQSPFDIEAAGVSTINDLYQNTYAFLDAMKVLGDSDLSDAQKMSQMWPKLRKLGMSIALLKGIPANNFMNLLDGIAANAADFATGKAGTFASQSPLQIAGTALIGSAQGRETSNKAVAGYIAQAMMEGRQAEAVRLYNEQLRQGKTADALNTAIATWQKQNIPQIREAAEAIEWGDLAGYNSLINELVDMGLSMSNAVKYVEAERGKMQKEGNDQTPAASAAPMTYDDIVSGMTKSESDLQYTNGQMNSLLEYGDVEQAKAIRDEMLKAGKKSSAINSSLTSHWKPLLQAAYAEGDMAEVRRITNMLVQMGMKRTTVSNWATSGSSTSSSSSSKKSGFGSGSFGSGSFGSSSKKSSSKKKTGFGSGSFGSGTFGK